MADSNALKTYRYLRIGMIGAVVLLGAAVVLERAQVDCWQTSISAYYYTPARAIFVGGLMAVGFALIVIKGSTAFEDVCLNFAGMLAPVVALVPTSGAGTCWSEEPNPLPINDDGSLAGWVVSNIDNNIRALLIAGVVGLLAAFVIALLVTRSVRDLVDASEPGMRGGLAGAAGLLGIGALAYYHWDDFSTLAHGYAAALMFGFLVLAVIAKAWEYWNDDERYFRVYIVIASLMIVGALAIHFLRIGGDHVTLVLEATEIALFAAFWSVQTKEHWSEAI